MRAASLSTAPGRNAAAWLVWAAGLLLALVAQPAAAQAAPVTSLRSLYVLHCAGCHAMDGRGVPDKGVPSMRGTLGLFMRSVEGRAFLVQVPGVNNAGLDDTRIAALTNWTISQFSADTAPPGWAPYTANEVAAARRQRPADVTAARAALVQRLRGEGVEIR